MDPIRKIRDAIIRGELTPAKLSARSLAAYLGKTTSVLYHHWGSVDGVLFAVSESGFELLCAALEDVRAASGQLPDYAEAIVRFGLRHPTLYGLMFERHYDWDALRAAGTFDIVQPSMSLWNTFVSEITATGSSEPDSDARILYAALHGMVSLALSGRANVGALSATDEDVAISSARTLAKRLCPKLIRKEIDP